MRSFTIHNTAIKRSRSRSFLTMYFATLHKIRDKSGLQRRRRRWRMMMVMMIWWCFVLACWESIVFCFSVSFAIAMSCCRLQYFYVELWICVTVAILWEAVGPHHHHHYHRYHDFAFMTAFFSERAAIGRSFFSLRTNFFYYKLYKWTELNWEILYWKEKSIALLHHQLHCISTPTTPSSFLVAFKIKLVRQFVQKSNRDWIVRSEDY